MEEGVASLARCIYFKWLKIYLCMRECKDDTKICVCLTQCVQLERSGLINVMDGIKFRWNRRDIYEYIYKTVYRQICIKVCMVEMVLSSQGKGRSEVVL